MATRVEVELDIFSGMPNPTWVLTEAEADSFTAQITTVPPAPPRELAGNLGHRGFIVQVATGTRTQSIRVQAGTVQITEGTTKAFGVDGHRELERWLLETGKPHLDAELARIVERDLGADIP